MLNNLCASRAFSLEFELSIVITFDVGLSKHALLYEPTASKQAVLHSPFQISSFSIFSLVYYGSTLFDIHLVSTVFISFYILDCRCNNKSSIGIVKLSFYGMHSFCGQVLKCISMDGKYMFMDTHNSRYFQILLIKYANVYFRLRMKRCH